jgi:hypothetical protein
MGSYLAQSYQISINRIYKPENESQSLVLAYTAVEKEDSGMDRSRWQVAGGRWVNTSMWVKTDRQIYV